MRVVTVWNPKGGAAKTTLTYHLAGSLARAQALRVLVADCDPQASISKLLLGENELAELHPHATVLGAFDGSMTNPLEIVRPSRVAGIDLAPGHKDIAGDYANRPWEAPVELQECVLAWAYALPKDWDVLLIDTPPNYAVSAWAALLAADALIVPVDPDPLGVSTIETVESAVGMVPTEYGVEHLGFVMTRVKTRPIYQLFHDAFREAHGERVFVNIMPESDMFARAIAHHQPIGEYSKRSKGSKCVDAIAGELIARLDRRVLELSGKGAA